MVEDLVTIFPFIVLFTLLVGAVLFFVLHYQKKTLQEQLTQKDLEIAYGRKMLSLAIKAQEMERKKVAKELHDSIGMMLMTLRLNLSSQPPLFELRNLVDETHENVKQISWKLMPSTLDTFGLVQSLEEMSKRLVRNKGINISVHQFGASHALDKDQEIAIYRIAQEAITNSIRHAHASQVEIVLNWGDHFLTISVKDNGVGFNFPKPASKIDGRHGLGLITIENRANLLGGKTTYVKNEPSGSIVNVKIPISAHDVY